ncbi:MAG: hypothetical protein WBC71_13315, partial [Salaquimonas sp.]
MSDTKKTDVILPLTGSKSTSAAFRHAILLGGLLVLAACSDDSNQTEVANIGQCSAAKEIAAALGSKIGGDIAAFGISDTPIKMPLLSFKDREGKAVDTASFEGKTILFNLWATWCAP